MSAAEVQPISAAYGPEAQLCSVEDGLCGCINGRPPKIGKNGLDGIHGQSARPRAEGLHHSAGGRPGGQQERCARMPKIIQPSRAEPSPARPRTASFIRWVLRAYACRVATGDVDAL